MSQVTAEERRIAELEAQVGALQSQARTASPPAPVPDEEFQGLARCFTVDCDMHGDRPLALRREQSVKLYDTSQGGIMRGVENSTVRAVPVNDGDLTCPGCGVPSAQLEAVPPVYARLAPVSEAERAVQAAQAMAPPVQRKRPPT